MDLRKGVWMLASLLGWPWRPAMGAEDREGLAALKAVTFEDGTVDALAFVDGGVFRHDGQTHRDVPPRVVLKWRLRPGPASNIRVELWLPTAARWNGRFLGLGNGGAAGGIHPNSLVWPLRAGYAVATTDMGTSPNDKSGIDRPDVWKDFGYRATHGMTVSAQRAITAYYGRPPAFSYFVGGSTGGQQALQEAQRYPDDYDGIVAEVPAHARTPLHAYFLWNYQIQQRRPFTPEQEGHVVAAGHEYLAGREPPALAGTAISDPRVGGADIEAVIALARRKDPSLTEDHAAALRAMFQGPRHAVTGEVIFGGVPLGAKFRDATGHLYLFDWAFGGRKKYGDIDFAGDIDAYTAALGPYLNAENPDLRAFAQRGGKLIATSGAADPVVPYHATLDYYERVVEVFGTVEAVQSFFRYYLVPGKDHGGSGPGVNALPSLLDALVHWRENGVAPEGLDGRRVVEGRTAYRIPVFPYPFRAVYDAEARTYQKEDAPRGGVERITPRFCPPPEGE